MDTHTLDLLEFAKIRALVAARAACSLGKEAALGLQPISDRAEIHDRHVLTTEMVEARRSGFSPPLGGLHDIRGTFAARKSAPCWSPKSWPRPPRRSGRWTTSTAG